MWSSEMGDKTFRDRIEEEVCDFAPIYASYLAAYKARVEARHAENEQGCFSGWDHAFAIPFDSSTKRYLAEHPEEENDFKSSSMHDAVIATIHELGLEELRLGAISGGDPRINLALDLGLLTVDDLAPLYVLPNEDQRSLGMGPITRAKPERDDPFFYRTLLEIFCRAYIASRGRRPWPLARKIDLAFDLDDIRRTLPDKKWNKKAVLKILREKDPYKSKYPGSSSATPKAGVGEDRVQEITDMIGPMDDYALERLKTIYEAVFFEVADERLQRRPSNLDEIKKALDEAGRIGDAMVR
jgi:hypothetical protein